MSQKRLPSYFIQRRFTSFMSTNSIFDCFEGSLIYFETYSAFTKVVFVLNACIFCYGLFQFSEVIYLDLFVWKNALARTSFEIGVSFSINSIMSSKSVRQCLSEKSGQHRAILRKYSLLLWNKFLFLKDHLMIDFLSEWCWWLLD